MDGMIINLQNYKLCILLERKDEEKKQMECCDANTGTGVDTDLHAGVLLVKHINHHATNTVTGVVVGVVTGVH